MRVEVFEYYDTSEDRLIDAFDTALLSQKDNVMVSAEDKGTVITHGTYRIKVIGRVHVKVWKRETNTHFTSEYADIVYQKHDMLILRRDNHRIASFNITKYYEVEIEDCL